MGLIGPPANINKCNCLRKYRVTHSNHIFKCTDYARQGYNLDFTTSYWQQIIKHFINQYKMWHGHYLSNIYTSYLSITGLICTCLYITGYVCTSMNKHMAIPNGMLMYDVVFIQMWTFSTIGCLQSTQSATSHIILQNNLQIDCPSQLLPGNVSRLSCFELPKICYVQRNKLSYNLYLKKRRKNSLQILN